MNREIISFEEYLSQNLGGGIMPLNWTENLTDEQLEELFSANQAYAEAIAADVNNINVPEQESNRELMFAGVGLLAGLILSKFIKL